MVARPYSVEYLEGCHLPDPEVIEIEEPFDGPGEDNLS